jgi:trk system potassium uptake protein TrkH
MYLFEKDNTLAGFGVGGKLIASMFGAVTPRTAGFNTVDTAALTPAARLLTILFMFIGGSPGSTAGGIKTTTIAIVLIYVFSNLRNSSGCNLFKRRISDDVIKKASMVFCLNLLLALVSCILILGTSRLAMEDVLFEVFSAISTVGMTTGITRDLNTFGRIVIIFLMYCGRIGSMTFALSLIQRPSQQEVTYPAERVTIG